MNTTYKYHISKNQFDEPIYLKECVSNHIEIHINAGVRAHIIDESPLSSRVITCVIHEGAHLMYNYLQKEAHEISQEFIFHLKSRASLKNVLIISGGQNTHIDVRINLEGEHADADVRGLYALKGSQQLTMHTFQHHQAPSAQSNLIIKGMLNDHSVAKYKGMILVDNGAKHTHAVQENKNILLSRNAHAQSIPSLEVLTNDVVCKHGSAVGYLDEQLLFYIQSRAIHMQIARQQLLFGFFAHVLEGVEASMKLEICEIIKNQSA